MNQTLKEIQALISIDTKKRITKLQDSYDKQAAEIKSNAEQRINQEHITYNTKIIQITELLLDEEADEIEVIDKIRDSVINKQKSLQKLVDDANEHLTAIAKQLDNDKEEASQLKTAVDNVITQMEKAQAKAVVMRA
jgi:uncharacterized protein YukE